MRSKNEMMSIEVSGLIPSAIADMSGRLGQFSLILLSFASLLRKASACNSSLALSMIIF